MRVSSILQDDNNTRICGSSKISCYDEAEDNFLQEHLIPRSTNFTTSIECNCLPACTSLTYDTEISQALFEFNELLIEYGISDEQLTG